MSSEVIAIVFSAIGVLVTLGGSMFGVFAWGLRRIDRQFGLFRSEVNERFEKVDQRFEKIGQELSLVRSEVSALRSEVNDVNVAVARLEGPQPRLILPPR